MSRMVVRKRYTDVSVALAKRAAALSRVTFVRAARYGTNALFIRLAASAVMASRCGEDVCRRARCKEEMDRTQLRR
jgi:hypothetical protein